ncbi:MAG: NINE protein [Clostridium sp.]
MSNYVTVTSHKKRRTALILCILGGCLGLHYFYVGRYGKGILFYFYCWIMRHWMDFRYLKNFERTICRSIRKSAD